MTTSTVPESTQTIELEPNYKIPVVLIIASVPLFFVNLWLGGIIGFLGLFLTFQTSTIRLRFTPTDLDVCRKDKLLKRFPYAEWEHWEIFWEKVPILFYFKEVKSIHFLPIIFDPGILKACLEQRCPRKS